MFNNYNDEIKEKGFLDIPPDPVLNLEKEIGILKAEKNAVILAHYYQEGIIQDIADFVGDSLQLSQIAADTDASIIVFAGVHFMAETAKILSPEKKVLIPDLNAGCSLAESIPVEAFKIFKSQYPDHLVVSYINTSAEIKAMTDITCTSSNAINIINSIDKKQKILFTPDKNLGNYINSITGRNMILWNGACHVHEQFSVEKIIELKKLHPDAKIIAHPECEKPILIIADFIGSTAALLKFTQKDSAKKYIIATESGIIHQMKKSNSEKLFLVAPPKDSSCGCNDCNFMKLISIPKIYTCLKYELPEVNIPVDIRQRAVKPILKMLEISKQTGLIS